MTKSILSILALAMVALFVGSTVSAVGVDGILTTSTAIKTDAVKVDAKMAADVKVPIKVDATSMTKVKIPAQKLISKDLLVSRQVLADQIQESKVDKSIQVKSDFKSAAVKVKAAIQKDRETKAGDSVFQGWTIQRIVNASKLSDVEKKILLASYTAVRKEEPNWQRFNIMMWNTDEKFMAIGKLSGIRENNTMSAYVRGYNSVDEQRFFMYVGNGTLAGVQAGKVFWGSYSNGMGVLHYEDGASMKFQYAVYQ